MNSVPSLLAFSIAMAFQFSAAVVLLYLLFHKEDRHRLPRLLAFFIVSLGAMAAIHDGDIMAPWKLYLLSAGWAIGIYSLGALIIRILRAHHLSERMHGKGQSICLECPMLNDVRFGGEETPRAPLPTVRFFRWELDIL
jgi:peptidoglycan/LPS O-acetylase OafA/YrhL